MQIFPLFYNFAILLFSEIAIFLINWGNKTSCRPILSVIILVINKSDSRCAVVRFCYHSYDYRPNWTPFSPITITQTDDPSLHLYLHGNVDGFLTKFPHEREWFLYFQALIFARTTVTKQILSLLRILSALITLLRNISDESYIRDK